MDASVPIKPLGALIAALAFARDVIDSEPGGLPVFLDRGFPPAVLADVEAPALRMAIELAEHLYPADMRNGLA